ncbi:AraC family transcriptional regulator, partial [Mycobacterium sp. ITM-2017-0098]
GLTFTTTPALALPAAIDTLVVPGGECLVADGVPRHLQHVLRAPGPCARRIASVCAGSFALGAAGLLDGRRATTHWRHLDTLAARHPSS